MMINFEHAPYLKNYEPTQKKVTLVGKELTHEKVYAIGDMFIIGAKDSNISDESIYTLVQPNSHEVKLINLRTGNRFNSGIVVKDTEGITQEEFKLIVGYLHDLLVKIKSIDFKINELEQK